MAPFGILEAGFCMVFRCASFWFWVPGTHFGTPEPKFGPGIWKLGSGWPGEVLGPKMGVGKTWFCEGMVSKLEIMGFPATQMDCMVPRRPLGKPVSPQPPLKHESSTNQVRMLAAQLAIWVTIQLNIYEGYASLTDIVTIFNADVQ